MLYKALFVAFLFGGTCLAQTSYCRPCTSCWPSDDVIQTFNQSLTGFVIQPNEVEKFQKASVVFNFKIYEYPGLIVEPLTIDDVKKTITFVQTHNIELAVRSSGSCLVGRSSVFGSLTLNMRNFRNISVNMDDPLSTTGASLTSQPAATWSDVHGKADAYGRLVQGGNSPVPAVGGETIGGGHGAVSRVLGLTVDNVIAFQIVGADRQLRNCTSVGCNIIKDNGEIETDPNGAELFWAVRGGGGSFGVVTSLTYKLHQPPPQFVQLLISWPIRSDVYGDVGRRVMEFYSEFVKTLPREWGGILLARNELEDGFDGSLFFALLYHGPWQDAYNSIAPLLTVEPDAQLLNVFINRTTFIEYFDSVDDYFPGRMYITNRFIQPSDLGQNLTNFIAGNLVDNPTKNIYCTFTHLGGAVSDAELSSSSVPEGMRSAVFTVRCYNTWQSEYLDDAVIGGLKLLSDDLQKLGKNMYYNEPDRDVVDWQNEFWFPNYDRLLQIKQIYDPQNTFTCRKCVGWNENVKSAATLQEQADRRNFYGPYGSMIPRGN